MPTQCKLFVTGGGPIRLKVSWHTFIESARESLSLSLGKDLAFDDDSFVVNEAHEGEIRAWDLPQYVYLTIHENRKDELPQLQNERDIPWVEKNG